MKILIKDCLIADTLSPYNNQRKNILIEDGIIKSVTDPFLNVQTDKEISGEQLSVSQGWVDVFASIPDPGFEYRETLQSGADAALAGGFTHVFCNPNTRPVVDNKAQVEYVVGSSKYLSVMLHPLGAISKKIEGKELAEMYDMYTSGAVAFTDGIEPVQSSALFLKALQYVRGFNGVVIQIPIDNILAKHGLMNEGIMSTRLGMPGIPAIAEELMIKRDLELVEYTRSHLHFTGVSTSKGLRLIEDAKNAGLNVTCSVTPYHAFYCDEDLQDYNTHLKVSPPLRTKSDMIAVRKAIESGVADCIATHHTPHDTDGKQCEFEYAKNGMIGFQTAFAALNHIVPTFSEARIAQLFSTNARTIFKLPQATIQEGNIAEITVFSKREHYTFTTQNNKSRSANSPFFNMELNGKVIGVINKGDLYLN